ncbi:TonB-dependent receptor [Acidipila sp. EB88]|uniref:TonB-dependent receptor n=1 Tax=Acidipila sp. EB88 TaxID=2305226 RepID=UPI000F5FF258|nr:TonB-dependent receptor [Acidipila sp. EB88]RRA48082.1 TonB-dependent receptor [Acidipila sp. EB88]
MSLQKAFLVLAFAGPALVARAQVDSGSISGTVADGQQQRLAGASIVLHNEATGADRTLTSGRNGDFSFSPLAIGTYTLTVQEPGFEQSVKTGISVTAQATLREDLVLEVGTLSQTVKVAAGTPQLEVESSSLQQLVSERSINDLPLNGRNATFLAQTAPGITNSQADSRGLAASGSFSANGARRGQNDYLLDGIDNNAAIADYVNQTQYVIMPPPDALQEFVVQTSNYSAEFGHSAGAVLNVSSKAGADQFHGDAWEYLRNDVLDARNYFATAAAKPAYRQNQFGFAVGGPVVIPKLYNGHGRTFFFFDYQGTRIAQDASKVVTVPTAAERSSGYTNLQDLITLQTGTRTDTLGRIFPVGTIFDPATSRAVTAGKIDSPSGLVATSTGYTRDPFYAGALRGQSNFTTPAQKALLNKLPATRLSPSAIQLLNLFPSPTAAGITNNYTSFPTVTNNSDGIDFRIDQHFTDSDSAFARYSYLDTDQLNPGPFQGIADGQASRPGNGATQAQNVAVSETHIFTPHVVNEARFGYSRVSDIRRQPYANQLGIPAEYGIGGIPQFAGNGGLPTLSFGTLAGLGQSGSLPSNKASDITQASDNVTISLRQDTLRTGFLYENIFYPTSTPSAARGAFGFNGIYTSVVNQTDGSTDRAQFLLNPGATTVTGGLSNVGGANSVSASSFPPISNLHRWYTGAYLQDDWRATDALTLNLGLRWEYYGVPTEESGRQANFVPGPSDPALGAKFFIPERQAANVPQAFLSLLAKDNIAFVPTTNNGLGTAQHTNFAPRVGFAYQVNPRTVIHAGFGLFYGGYENYGLSASPAANFPFNIATSYSAANAVTPLTATNSIGTLGNGLTNVPLSADGANLSSITLLGRQYTWKSAYDEAFNVQLQYQLTPTTVLKLAYAGSLSRHLQTPISTNTLGAVLPANANAQTNSFFPDFARGGTFITPEGATNYNGLQIDVTRRWARDMLLDANYTRSKCLGDARDQLDNDIGAYRAPYVPGAGIGFDYGRCDTDVRNIFHASGTYELPFGRDHALLTHGAASAIAGGWSLQAIAVVQDGQPFTVACTTTTAAGLGCNAFTVPGQSLYSHAHPVAQFLNPAAFANPAATATGLAALGGSPTQVSGPPDRRLDASLFRQIPLFEQTRLELRAEAFNVTNTPNFANPGSLTFTSPSSFASITSTLTNSRQLQFAAKLYW